MNLSELAGLLRAAVKENQPKNVIDEIITMVDQKIEEGMTDQDHMHIEDYIEKLRQRDPGAVKDFAEKAGMHPNQLYRYLGGTNTNIRLDTMLRLSKASGHAVRFVEDFYIEESKKANDIPDAPEDDCEATPENGMSSTGTT